VVAEANITAVALARPLKVAINIIVAREKVLTAVGTATWLLAIRVKLEG